MMDKEELLKEIMKLPKIETNNPICTMNSITVDDLMSAIDRLKKVPKYYDLLKENKQLKEQLLVAQTNEETFRLEMEDITKILGLDEDTIFDDVKAYSRSLKENWIKLKEYAKEIISTDNELYGKDLLDKMQELEQGSDSK